MECIVFPAVVLSQVYLDAMARALDGVGVYPCFRIDELYAEVYRAMPLNLSTEIAVCSPRIADDRSAGVDLVKYYGHQCAGCSVRH
jgi:hypothetical protein